MSELINRTFTNEEQQEIRKTITEAIRIQQEIDDLKGGLRDAVKAKAEMLCISPKLLNSAIKAKYKENLQDAKDHVDDVEELLKVAKLHQ